MIKGNIFLRHAAFFLSVLSFLNAEGQQEAVFKYPQGYFANPLGIPMSLAANFGNCDPVIGIWGST
jgi:hypothetical protein